MTPRQQVAECTWIAIVLLNRSLLDQLVFGGRVLEQPVTVVLLGYVLVRVLFDGVYLVPCAAGLAGSLLTSADDWGMNWFVAILCPHLNTSRLRVVVTAAPLAVALVVTLWKYF